MSTEHVWYGSEAFETAVLERFGRGADQVGVCVRNRMAAVRLRRPTLLVDLTVSASTLGAPSDLGDRVDVHYADTQTWARAIVEDLDPDGIRYHSARHRNASGSVGVNVALFIATEDEPLADVPLAHAGAWRRLLTIMDRVGIAVEQLPYCARCR